MSTPNGLNRVELDSICTNCSEMTPFIDDDGQPYCEGCWDIQEKVIAGEYLSDLERES